VFREPQHGALVLGIVTGLTANWVSGRFAFPPGGYGILFGRMLQIGIVSRYLAEHCPDPKLKLCPFREELPRDADAFLWGESVFNELGRFAGLGDEMRTIVPAVFASIPGCKLRRHWPEHWLSWRTFEPVRAS
jgi:hypothetical protein